LTEQGFAASPLVAGPVAPNAVEIIIRSANVCALPRSTIKAGTISPTREWQRLMAPAASSEFSTGVCQRINVKEQMRFANRKDAGAIFISSTPSVTRGTPSAIAISAVRSVGEPTRPQR
jgi:hypothetical protein